MIKSVAFPTAHFDEIGAGKSTVGSIETDSEQALVKQVEPFIPLLSTEDVCAIFRRSERTIRRWVEKGSLPAIHVGGAQFFEPEHIRALIAGRLRR